MKGAPSTSRRGAMLALPGFAMAPGAALGASPNPDSALIEACSALPRLIRAVNDHPGDMDATVPCYAAYCAALDVIDAVRPATLAGWIAKARAAKVEAWNPTAQREVVDADGHERWAWDLMEDMLRLHGVVLPTGWDEA